MDDLSAGRSSEPLALASGCVIVLEGLDKAGKSTQVELLKKRVDPASAVWAHMPSGRSSFTQSIYDLLESDPPTTGLGRQLTHLACHSESMPFLKSAANKGALVLDRWWWSTVAYGWYGSELRTSGMDERSFRSLIDHIWQPVEASIVFLFLTPHLADSNNADGVATGYRDLLHHHTGPAVLVPDLSPTETHEFIVAEIISAGLTR